MTEATRIYRKLSGAALVAVAVGLLAIYWSRGLVSMMVALGSFFVVTYLVFTGRAYRRLGATNAADAGAAREAFFRQYPWLRRQRQQANSTVERDARKNGARPSP
jgi:hypothetical protein